MNRSVPRPAQDHAADHASDPESQSASRRVLILGARGHLGQAAVRAFAGAGWSVLAQRRPTAVLQEPVDPRVEALGIDLADLDALAAAAAGASVVVNGLSPSDYSRRRWAAELPWLGQQAIAISQRLGALLMLPGNVYPFGRTLPRQLLEDTAMPADTHHGRLRLALEQRLRQASAETGLRVVVIRAGDFYGGGPGGWLDQVILKSIRRGRLTTPADLDTVHAWAWLPDLAQTFVAVAQRQEQLDPFSVLHFGGHAVSIRDWLDVLDPARRLRVSRLPWGLVRLSGLFAPTMRSIYDMRYLWQRPHQLVNARLQRLIGAEPHTPFPGAASLAAQALGWSPGPR